MQTLPRDTLHARMPLCDRKQAPGEPGLELPHARQNIFVGDDAEIGADRGHADRMTAQCPVVLPTLTLELLDDGLRHHDRRDRRRTTAQRFAKRHDIRAALGALEREPSTRPSGTGHYFIGDPDNSASRARSASSS